MSSEEQTLAPDSLPSIRSSRQGLDLSQACQITFYILFRQPAPGEKAKIDAIDNAFPCEGPDVGSDPYFLLKCANTMVLANSSNLFTVSETVSQIARQHELHYDEWTAKRTP